MVCVQNEHTTTILQQQTATCATTETITTPTIDGQQPRRTATEQQHMPASHSAWHIECRTCPMCRPQRTRAPFLHISARKQSARCATVCCPAPKCDRQFCALCTHTHTRISCLHDNIYVQQSRPTDRHNNMLYCAICMCVFVLNAVSIWVQNLST